VSSGQMNASSHARWPGLASGTGCRSMPSREVISGTAPGTVPAEALPRSPQQIRTGELAAEASSWSRRGSGNRRFTAGEQQARTALLVGRAHEQVKQGRVVPGYALAERLIDQRTAAALRGGEEPEQATEPFGLRCPASGLLIRHPVTLLNSMIRSWSATW
jgi:hypothetical protein